MKKLIAFVVTASLVFGAAAYAQQEREFDLDKFDRIDISAGIVMVAAVGEEQSIVAKSDTGSFDDLKLRVRNGVLEVSREYNKLRWHSKKAGYKIVVSTPSLRAFEASSGSHARIDNVDAEAFYVDLSSGAHAKINGRCGSCNIDLSSGAHLSAKDLSCVTADVDVSSGGHGTISTNDALVADASSGGHFTIYGAPRRVSIDRSSGGRVKLVNATQITDAN